MATTATGTGVSFALTDEQKALRDLAHAFAEKEIRPKAAEFDEHQTHPADVVAKAHEVGLMNLHLPESLGGPELSAFDGMLVGEELNWGWSGVGGVIVANGRGAGPGRVRGGGGLEGGCAGIGRSIPATGLGAGPILIAGTEEQKREWLAPLVEEPIL